MAWWDNKMGACEATVCAFVGRRVGTSPCVVVGRVYGLEYAQKKGERLGEGAVRRARAKISDDYADMPRGQSKSPPASRPAQLKREAQSPASTEARHSSLAGPRRASSLARRYGREAGG